MLNKKYKKYSWLDCFVLNIFVALGIAVKKLYWVINKYIIVMLNMFFLGIIVWLFKPEVMKPIINSWFKLNALQKIYITTILFFMYLVLVVIKDMRQYDTLTVNEKIRNLLDEFFIAWVSGDDIKFIRKWEKPLYDGKIRLIVDRDFGRRKILPGEKANKVNDKIVIIDVETNNVKETIYWHDIYFVKSAENVKAYNAEGIGI